MADTIKEAIEEHGGRILTYREKNQKFREPHHRLMEDYAHADAVLLAEIKRIVSEAKPDKRSVRKTKPTLGAMLAGEPYAVDQANGGFNEAIDEYHANLMKALGEE